MQWIGEEMKWFRRRKVNDTNRFPLPFAGLSEASGTDYRGIPTMTCPCGCDWLLMCAMFDPDTREVGMYILDGLCASCGSLVSLPTPIDELVMGDSNDLW